MGTTLKQICNIATKLIIKKSPFLTCSNPEEALKDIKQLRKLIENHWNEEVSSLAKKDLNENKYAKPKLLPVTSDVVKFQKFVMTAGKNACQQISQAQNHHVMKKEDRRLSECVLTLTLLLNRKRISEIDHLKLMCYKSDVSQNQ